MNNPLVEVTDLKVYFPMRGGLVLSQLRMIRAVDGVSFGVHAGEILAMVGESGCGKTTIGKTILRLIPSTNGVLTFQGEDITRLQGVKLRTMRKRMQLIYQDPYESLDPRQSVFEILEEPLLIHTPRLPQSEIEGRVYSALESTGLHPVREIAERYPHHLSGGQRQRVAIAAAMILEPEFIITDEPVSMLDVSIRADILRLMLELRQKKQLTYLFITHDLSLAWMIADRILVLYLGKIMEVGAAHSVIHAAKHPYTQALVSVIPLPRPKPERLQLVLEGETPSPLDIPTGCRFYPRCWLWKQIGRPQKCLDMEPELRDGGDGHLAACHFPGHLA